MNLILYKKGTQLNDLCTMYNLTAVFFYFFINTLEYSRHRRRNVNEFDIPNVIEPVDLDELFRQIDELVTDQIREEQMSLPVINTRMINLLATDEEMRDSDNTDDDDESTDDDLLMIGDDGVDDEENMSEVFSPDIIDFYDEL